MLLLMVPLPTVFAELAAPCIHQGEAPFISCHFIPLCSEGKSIWCFLRYTAVTFLLLLPATRVEGLLRRRDATGTGLPSFTRLLSQAKSKTGSPVRLHFTTTATTCNKLHTSSSLLRGVLHSKIIQASTFSHPF